MTRLLWACAFAGACFCVEANAGIVCRDDYPKVGGAYISTPYCRDNYLARVARGYGVRVSDGAIRENPNLKKEICRHDCCGWVVSVVGEWRLGDGGSPAYDQRLHAADESPIHRISVTGREIRGG